ncbi:unnamed protein product [Brassica rapa subsp. trilocularis]
MNRKPGYGAQLHANLEPTKVSAKSILTGALKPKRVNSSLQYACPSVRLPISTLGLDHTKEKC